MERQEWPPREVNDRSGQGFVHGHVACAESIDALPGSDRIVDGLPEANPNVLDRVVRVYLKVAAALELDIEKAMTCKGCEHVIEETHARLYAGLTGAVEGQLQIDVRFGSPSLDARTPIRQHTLPLPSRNSD